jgi:hypothetical protein
VALSADEADREGGRIPSTNPAQFPSGIFQRAKNLIGSAQEDFTGCGELNLTTVALEQCDAEFGFQIPNLHAHRGLSYVEQRRGSGKTQFFRDGLKIA